MKLDRVTITGADDSIEPEQLRQLSEEFPFVEWGILVSKNSMGRRRFPTADWLHRFRTMTRAGGHIDASMHLCGRLVRGLLVGDAITGEFWEWLDAFQRVQLNFHAEGIQWRTNKLREAIEDCSDEGQREFIFQIDGNRGEEVLRDMIKDDSFEVSCVPLFDLSHGAGVLASEWPKPILAPHVYHGYAGGLGPDNLAEQIPLIGKAAGDTPIWIDMETRVRSDNDRQFDLAKVRQCLEIAKPFIASR